MQCIFFPFVHFASLCSPDALSAPKNTAAANWPIFKFFISNVFLHKFHSRSPCTAYFRLRIGKQENSHFNWILSNIILFRPEPSLFPISLHFPTYQYLLRKDYIGEVSLFLLFPFYEEKNVKFPNFLLKSAQLSWSTVKKLSTDQTGGKIKDSSFFGFFFF